VRNRSRIRWSLSRLGAPRVRRRLRRYVSGVAAVAIALSAAVVGVSFLAAPAASAAPAGSEYPQNWSLNGRTATGTTPSGVKVTATVSGPMTVNPPGDVIFSGPRPSYLPPAPASGKAPALRFGMQNCTNTAVDGCGTITYTFSQPVKLPVIYVGDFGGNTNSGSSMSTYHNHPMTLSDGTFSLDTTGSQSPRMEMRNGNTTVGIINPRALVGTSPGDGSSCGTFGCGAYRINTSTETITSLTLSFGYDGTGNSLDWWGQILGITPLKSSLSLEKTASPSTITKAGEKVSYSFKITNTGEVPVTNPTINETAFSGTGTKPVITCPTGEVAVGASVTCTAEYTATQADVDAGTITNTATATATPPGDMKVPVSDPSTATVTAQAAPALAMVKSADKQDLVAGETITYSFKVTNTGNVSVKDAKITEGDFTGSGTMSAVTCPDGAKSLAPGASVTCTATYTVTQDDVDRGSVNNTATATGAPAGGGDPVTSDPSQASVPNDPKPGISVVKSADKTKLVADDTITYSFKATNTGNVTLTDVKINEGDFTGSGKMSAITCPDTAKSLAPGASVTCTASYHVTQADVDAGSVKNTATATGTPPTGDPVTSGPSDSSVTADQKPGISVVKSADKNELVEGETITYSFVATNTGNVTLKDINVTEGDFTGTGKMSAITCPNGVLEPEDSVTCTATYTVTQADVDAGTLKNTATSHGTSPTGDPVSSEPGHATTPSDPAPALTVEKTADKQNLVVGESITFWFKVINTGNVTLKDITINDGPFSGSGKMSAITCPDTANSLAPGANVFCSATYQVTQADVDAGKIDNSATATGTSPAGDPVTAEPSKVSVPADQKPGISVVKTADKTGLVAGETIKYSFKATNTGNVTLTDVKVNEGTFTGSGKMSAVTCPDGAKSLAPGASVTCMATYQVTQADVDRGSVNNTATATGTPPTGDPVTSDPSGSSVTADQKPGISVVKTADKTGLVAGGTIKYSFKATNTGNVTLTDVKVNEGTFTGSGKMSAITCPDGAKSLAPGASVTCTATYQVTQADVDAGKIDNSATATGTPPGGKDPVSSEPSNTTVPSDPHPGLSLVKTADQKELVASETVHYSFKVTNTGNVTLHDVQVNEGDFTGSGKMSAITCPDAAKSLAPGASVTCTATYTVTQDDVDHGSLQNTATATGTPPGGGGPVDSDPSAVKIPSDPHPGLSLVKSADKTGLVAGETIAYTFVLTNTGNVTLSHLSIDETQFTGSGKLSDLSCPEGDYLRPGEQSICRATYQVTQDDVDRGSVENTATATGTPPNGGDPVTSEPSKVAVPQAAHPGISLVKTADQKTLVAGGTITYSFKATNTGNVTLRDVKVNEGAFTGSGKLSAITCPEASTSLAPGQWVRCTATYQVTQADVDRGSVENTATAAGTPPTGDPVSSDPSKVAVVQDAKPGLSVVKSADKTELVVGETVKYSFVVTNTGNVTLHDVKVNEGEFSGTGQLSDITCPDGLAALAPAAQVTCTATYQVTQDDVDAGTLTNTATVTGTPPGGGEPVTSSPSKVALPQDPKPGISMVKSADKKEVKAGEKIGYTFLVTNTGDVTLKGVAVNEGAFSGSGKLAALSCPAGASILLPGQHVSCTASYTATEADATAGTVHNTASATATPPSGKPVTTAPSTATVKITPLPAPPAQPAPPALASTGAAIGGGLAVAVSLSVLGGVLYLAARRRKANA